MGVVRSTVPIIKLDDVFTSKEDIAQDPKVKGAMNEINAAQRQRVAAKDRAEAEKIMVVKAAEADAESKYLSGTGMARQRQAIISGLRDSVVNFQKEVDGISSKDVMEMMMMTQYFDTMKEVGTQGGNSTIFVPSGPGAAGEASSAIRSGLMQGSAAMAGTKR